MSKTHYQTWVVSIHKEKQALCNDYLRSPTTTTDLSLVDCQRCIKAEVKYRRAYDKGLLEMIWDKIFMAYMMWRFRRREGRL